MLKYLPSGLDLGQALELLKEHATEPDARVFLWEWLADGKLEYHHPPHPEGAQIVELKEIEWGTLQAIFVVRISISRDPWNPAWSRQLTLWSTKITVRRDDILALIKPLLEFAGPGQVLQPAKQRGRKPRGETRDVELLNEILRKIEAGEVSSKHGEPTKVAREIQKIEKFNSYQVDTIRRKIVRELT